VALQACGVAAQGLGQLGAADPAQGGRIDHVAQCPQLGRAFAVFHLQAVEQGASLQAALAQQAKQKIVFLGVVRAVDKLLNVVKHRGKKRGVNRGAGVYFGGNLVNCGGQTPQIAVVLANDAECVHGDMLSGQACAPR
jgi:hypothetical protein